MSNEQHSFHSQPSTTPSLKALPSEVLLEILQWAQELPLWQQETLRRLFKRADLDDQSKDELFEIACVELKLMQGTLACAALLAQDLPIAQAHRNTRLIGLKNLEHVNAIKPDQRLPIGEGLTVIYGDNGSGKSGYARVLKKACRSRSAEEILPNVYNLPSAQKPASAIFEFQIDDKTDEEKWLDGGKSPEWLGRFAVFDSTCSRIYISDKTEPQLMPFGLDVLPRLASIVEHIKTRLEQAADAPVTSIDSLKGIVKPGTAVAQLLSTLSADTRIEFVDRQAIFAESDEQSLVGLGDQLKELQANSPDELRRKLMESLKYLEDLEKRISLVLDLLGDVEVNTLRDKQSQIKTLEQAMQVAGQEKFANSEVAGVGSASWRELLLAAEKYSQTIAYPNKIFPVSGSNCVLCHQPLSEEAHVRLTRFREFVRNETATKKHAAQVTFDQQLSRIRLLDVKVPSYEQSLNNILGDPGILSVRSFFADCAKRAAEIQRAASADDWNSISAIPPKPDCMDKSKIALQKQWDTVANVESKTNAIATVQTQIAELEARKLLKENLSVVQQHLKESASRFSYRKAAESIKTTPISNRAKVLQTKYLSEQFKARLLDELTKAGISNVVPDILEKTEKGKLLRKLGVTCGLSASPEAIFSEGERSAVGLACFMAELGTEHETSGVIFDDPVTSLDHRIRTAIADRLILESKSRQVIVFTHDLVFFRELLSIAVKEQVEATVQCIDRLGAHTGIISDRPPWDASTVKDRFRQLKPLLDKVAEAESRADVQEYRNILETFYKRLRDTWERIVEEYLFNGVVCRLERPVYTQQLIAATVDDELITNIFEAMSMTSQRLHDNAAGVGEAQVTLDQARKDLEVLDIFIKNHSKKKSIVEERRKHLKGKLK